MRFPGEMQESDLREFVDADLAVKDLEAKLELQKHLRSKFEARLLDQMGMEAKKDAVVEWMGTPYKVYTRRFTGLRVTSPEVAEADLKKLGLEAFIDYKIDTARLATWYRKQPAGETLLMPKGLDWFESFKLYAIKKR